MTLIPYGASFVCRDIRSLRDFIEQNRKYFSENEHSKIDAGECDAALNAMAIYRQKIENPMGSDITSSKE